MISDTNSTGSLRRADFAGDAVRECDTSIDESKDAIQIRGAREHNLKNLSVDIPRGQFVVVTGVSGSGKSTLAFDIVFAEGQRRFLDSMSAYARQFVEQLARPDVDLIAGIPPTVSIEQRNSRGGGKSTVATVTEIYHFVRLLFARLGEQFCPDCEMMVRPQTRDSVGRHLLSEMRRRGDLLLLAPVVRNRKGFHTDVATWAARHGYKEIRADGKLYSTNSKVRLDRFREHDVEIVIGVLEKAKRRLNGRDPQLLIDEAMRVGHGTLFALDNRKTLTVHSTERVCPGCQRSFEQCDPKDFSYNSSRGWCPKCRGFGELFYLPDAERGARADAIEESWFEWQEGKRELCPECHGMRLNRTVRAVRLSLGATMRLGRQRLNMLGIDTLNQALVSDAFELFKSLEFSGARAEVSRDVLPEIRERLRFLNEVGLGYLQLGRSVTTLSGGEGQRIRLAAQLGSNLSGVLYVLDEPTIGLHMRDNEMLLDTLEKLRGRGNSLLVVEHDEDTMRRADWIVDLGPGAGVTGGKVVAAGTLSELLKHPDSITGKCLEIARSFPARGDRRKIKTGRAQPYLTLEGAQRNNLKNLTLRFPLERLVVVTGVSGSGKSTLIRECLLPALKSRMEKIKCDSDCGTVSGHDSIRSVYEVDQTPIGRTPRSTPATYVGFFTDIRELFAQIPEARLRGYTSSRFSFNSAQGRCPACEGAGVLKLEMNFLPPAYVRCESCLGTRFNRETLDIQFHGKNIAEVLELSVAEALEFFAAFRKIRRPLEALRDTGLDYLKLGQTSPTLSGGEAQRVKLVTHLCTGLTASKEPMELLKETKERARKPVRNLFLLEEPTIGLHMSDVHRLVEVLQRLVDAGHSVLVIEHNPDLIAEADWVIDLGPEGGQGGGRVVAQGTPERIVENKNSHTGRFLRKVLRGDLPARL